MQTASYKVYLYVLMALFTVFLVGCSSPQSADPPIAPKTVSSHPATNTAASAPRLEAKLLSARLVPFTTAQGKETVEVICQWRNNGNTPLRVVKANITAYDADGTPVGMTPTNDYTIAALSKNKAVAPGAIYKDPPGEGFIIVPLPGEKQAVRADVAISSVDAKTALDE